MKKLLENRIKEEIAIIDTSILISSQGMINDLSNKCKGFRRSPKQTIIDAQENLGRIQHIVNFENLVILKEVHEELEFGMTRINQGLKYLKQCASHCKGNESRFVEKIPFLKSYAESVYRFVNRLDNNLLRIGFYNDGLNHNFRLNEIMHTETERVVKELNRQELDFYEKVIPQMRTGESYDGKIKLPFEEYRSSLEYAFDCSRDFRIRKMKDSARKDKYSIGDKSHTDTKIAATAFALSYYSPILLMSGDKDLCRTVDRMEKGISNKRVRDFYGLREKTDNSIKVYNPYLNQNAEESESVKEQVIL